MILGITFPSLPQLVEWPEFFGGDVFGVNKVVLVYFFAIILTFLLFMLGAKKQLVPRGAQNLAELCVELVQKGVIMHTLGPRGMVYTPFLLSLFLFIFFSNIFSVIPVIQMPATGRIALPMFLAVVTWVIFNGAGIKSHGFFGYLRHVLIPSGVPKIMVPITMPIEFVSTFFVRPFSLMIRLFANMLAGHILLVTFTLLAAALWTAHWTVVLLPLPVFGVVFFVAFKILVSFLQAYVFTLLAAVYIDSATSHEH